MLFNSFEFAVFFPVVTLLYFLLPHRFRWFHLLAASCLFYMFFVPEYILILFFTIIVDYYAGIFIEDAQGSRRKLFLVMSLVANLGVLGFFKYYNFFIDNINFVTNGSLPLLRYILPIGLSFHTFQAMSYTIEVFRGNQKAERHFGIYALYVMFYPQLVAGPIERPQNMLHQFHEKHFYNRTNFMIGIRLIVWGLFKKIVIADRMGIGVDAVYSNPGQYGFYNHLLAIFCFAIQIYCDFSGYSNIALGTARVMGFDLMQNFNVPFAAKNLGDYWRRWHISLSTWFNDYLFNPVTVAYRDWGIKAVYLGLFVTFAASGLWHGAAWTFIIWGVLHAFGLIYEAATRKQRKKFFKKIPEPWAGLIGTFFTLAFVLFTWIFFRAYTIADAFTIIKTLVTFDTSKRFVLPLDAQASSFSSLSIVIGVGLYVFVQWVETKSKGDLSNLQTMPKLDLALHVFALAAILMLGSFNQAMFIYFQF